MRKTWWGLFTNSVDHWLSFPTPTHMHIFSNHNSGTTILIQSRVEFSRLPKNIIVNDSDLVSNNGEITNFNLLLSFFDQVTWCNATRPNRPHQNKRKQLAIVDCTHTVLKALSTHVSIVLTWVSVHIEDGSNQSSFFTHVHKGPVPKYSLMSTKDQYRITHSMS
jgi:ligand-binding SRPBCC domain-containing protein